MTPQPNTPNYGECLIGSKPSASEHDWWHHTVNLWGSQRKPIKGVWDTIARHQRRAAKRNEHHLVFCGSMMDIFEYFQGVRPKGMDLAEWAEHQRTTRYMMALMRYHFFRRVIPKTPNLLWQLTTKRPEDALTMLSFYWDLVSTQPPKNMQIVVTMENASEYNKRMMYVDEITDHIPVQLSIEPCFWQPSEVREFFQQANLDGISRIIVGGESGKNARKSDIDAFRAFRDGCEKHGIPFFFKQHGKHVWASQDPVFGATAEAMGDTLLKVSGHASKLPLDGQHHHQHPKWTL